MRSFVASVFSACLLIFSPAGQTLEPPSLLLAETVKGNIDVAAYLVSEKLDGVRAYWDGRTLRFRSGNVIRAPQWFVGSLPKQALDGELWMGRGTFERLSAAVRREQPDDREWREIRYMIFELPGHSGSFIERAEEIKRVVAAAGQPWLQAVEQFRLPDRKSLDARLAEVAKAGGEGLMLHLADAPYQSGRSDVLLKLKLWQDAEATVIGHVPGKGKYRNVLGALRVRTDDGRVFSLGSGLSDDFRRNPPPIGTRVTYRYRHLTEKGLPRFATFWRLREGDL
jgi:DNA ligase 1